MLFFSPRSRISKHNKEEVLSKAENDLASVTDRYMSRLVKELQGTDFWKLRRAYTFAVSILSLLSLLLGKLHLGSLFDPNLSAVTIRSLTFVFLSYFSLFWDLLD